MTSKANRRENCESVASEILRLRELRRQIESDGAVRDERQNRIKSLQTFIKAQPAAIAEFDEALVRRLIAKIVVFQDRFIVEFKSGMAVEIAH